MYAYEKNLFNKGIRYIAGVDEVGRGPLAGPLVASAVILNLNRLNILLNDDFSNYDVSGEMPVFYTQIKDSKALTSKKRCYINERLIKEVIDYSIVEISHTHLDRVGISKATQEAFFKSIHKLKYKPEHILTDNFPISKITPEHQTNIVRGDSLSISIAAASIIAKVYRDNLMVKMHHKYPEYGFFTNKGYGTGEHIAALTKYGPCAIHRKSFAPLKSLFN